MREPSALRRPGLVTGVPTTSVQDGIRLCQPVALSGRPEFSTAMPSEPVVLQTGETAACGAQLAHSVNAQEGHETCVTTRPFSAWRAVCAKTPIIVQPYARHKTS